MDDFIANFRTNVLLKNIIGQDLINNDNIAILELVKNAFDAGSKKVRIELKNIKHNDDDDVVKYSDQTSRIIIQDFGSGMSQEDITEKWLNIAYSDKKTKKEEFGRLLAGAKGIGRFSCDRLGKYLNIYTRKAGGDYTHVSVDWTSFEIDNEKDLEIQHIPVHGDTILSESFTANTGFKEFENGTLLEIVKLRSKWSYLEKKKEKGKLVEDYNIDALVGLRKYLERLINPNQAFGERNKFEINISAKEFIEEDVKNKNAERPDLIINGEVNNKIFKQLDFRSTSIEASIKIKDGTKTLTTILKDKGRDIYELVEDVSERQLFNNLTETHIIVYFLNTYAKTFFAKQTGQRSVEFGSIFLFKNGFRISPYGDEGDDWLGLEVRKGQGQRRFLGTRDIVGRIEVRDTNGVYREVTSREGLVNNQLFIDLKEFFYLTLKRLEKYVVEGLKWDSIPEEIQKTLNKKNSSFSDEVFQLSQEQKDAYAVDAIRNIVKTSGKDILTFKINPDLIYSLADEQRSKFNEFYEELGKITGNRLDISVKDSLNEIRRVIDRKDEEIRLLKEGSITVDSSDLFHRNDQDKDDQEVVALQHHINQSSERIKFGLNQLKSAILQKENNDILLDILNRVLFENQKVSTLSKFVTKAKFNLVTTYTKQDLVKFINEYLVNVYEQYDHKKLNNELIQISIQMKEKFEFNTLFRPIDFIIVIDNLLDNAYKAGASLMKISIERDGRNAFRLIFTDNGRGIDSKVTDIDRIFDFGYTTRVNGTGIGLYHVRNILSKMKGEISVEPVVPTGVKFIISIKK